MSERFPSVMQRLEWALEKALMADYCEARAMRAWKKGAALDGAAFAAAARQYRQDADALWDCMWLGVVEAA